MDSLSDNSLSFQIRAVIRSLFFSLSPGPPALRTFVPSNGSMTARQVTLFGHRKSFVHQSPSSSSRCVLLLLRLFCAFAPRANSRNCVSCSFTVHFIVLFRREKFSLRRILKRAGDCQAASLLFPFFCSLLIDKAEMVRADIGYHGEAGFITASSRAGFALDTFLGEM